MTQNKREELNLDAQVRDQKGTGGARALRRTGQIPAIIYGGGKPELKIAIEQKPLTLAYEKGGFRSRLVSINTGKEIIHALPREVQIDPISDAPIHADFLRVEKGTVARIKVKVNFKNREKSPGIKRGGVLNIVRHEVELFCNVDSIPQTLEANLEGLEIGASIHISHIKLPEGVEPTIKGRDFTIATIAGRQKEEEVAATAAAPAEGEAAAAPAAGAAAPAAGAAAPAAAAPKADAKKK